MYFDIGKQKVIWILKCRKNDEKAAENALRIVGQPTITNIHVVFQITTLIFPTSNNMNNSNKEIKSNNLK